MNNDSVWMNTFCNRVYVLSLLHIRPQLCVLHILAQLYVRFIADTNSCKLNGTPNLRFVRQRGLRQMASDNVVLQPSVLFQWSD